MSGPAHAAGLAGPAGGQVTAGSGSITQSGSTTTIQQNSQTLSLSWQSFNVSPGETVNFLQPGASSIAVNRILGNTASDIYGHLNANGQVWLINPNGILFGKGSQVNVGGLVASTLDVSDDALQASGRSFSGPGKGSVVNQGTITAAEGGYVALVGNQVSNQGTISARLGTVALAGGSAVTLTFSGNQLLHVQVDQSTLDNLAENKQLIVADGGQVLMSAGAKDAVMASLVNNTGVIQARTVENHEGTITLLGGMEAGTVAVGGKLDASAPDGGNGGSIETSAAHFQLAADAQISAGARSGKAGTWLVDPTDLTIDATAATTISNTLNGGTNVTEQTTATGASGVGNQTPGAGDINVDSAISWTNANANLSLLAFNGINVNAPVTGAGGVTMQAAGSKLTIGAGASVKGGTGVTLSTTANFVNNGGATAVSTGTAAPWLIYSTNPTLDTAGGLTPAFIQYNAPAATAPAATGNGFLYSLAPTLGITGLNGTVSKVYDGNTAASLTGANLATTGLVNGNLVATATGAYASSDAASGIAVTSPSSIAAITLTDSTGSIPVYGYKLAGAPVTASIGTITPAPLTASIVGNPTKVYNATTTATLTAANYSLTGFATGQGGAVIPPGDVAYAGADAGVQPLTASLSAANISANSGTKLSNYSLPTTVTGPGTITRAPVLFSGVLANSKVYDGTTGATLNTSGVSVFGVLAPDIGQVSFDQSAVTVAFASPNVGNNIPVNVSGVTLTGPKASNYFTVANPVGFSANITPKMLTVSGATANDKVYDATNVVTLNTAGAVLTGLVPTDAGKVTLSSVGATGLFSQSDVGNNLPVTATGFSLTGAAANNYAFTQPSGLLASITPATLLVSVSGYPTKVYDGTTGVNLTATDFAITGFAGGQGAAVTQVSAASYASKNAGTGIGMTVDLTSSDLTPNAGTALSNYIISPTASGTGTIMPAPLTAMIVGNPTKTFDGTATATLNGANYQLTGFINGESIGVTQTIGAYATPNVGVQNVTATLTTADYQPGNGTLLSNYLLPTSITGFGTIVKAQLTGTLSAAITGNPTKVYDGSTVATMAPSDFTLSGFVGSDSATVNQAITGQYGTKNAGQQPVSASLIEADFTAGPNTNLNNYAFPVVAFGTGTIIPAPLTVSIINNPTKVYDGTTSVAIRSGNFQINGLVSGEGAQINPSPTFTYASANAGSEAVTGSLAIGNYAVDSGTLLSNYALATSASGPGTIAQAPLFVTGVHANSKVYDTTTVGTLNVVAAALSGLVATDTGNVALASSAASTFSQANVGSALPVAASGFSISGGAAANYALQPITNLSANITPAPLSLTGVVANNKFYDATTAATLNVSGAALGGVLGTDTVIVSGAGATVQFGSVNVGNNLNVVAGGFTIGGASAANYTLAQPSGLTANITPAPIVAMLTGSPTKLYDGTTPASLTAADFTLSGFVAGQGASVPQTSSSNYVTPNAGTGLGVTATMVLSDFQANAGTYLSNYALPTTASGNLGVITPRVLSLTGTRVYDSTTNAAATIFGTNGVLNGINGDTLTLGGNGALATKNVGVQQPFAAGGLAGFTLTGNGSALASNYTFTGGTDWVTITPAILTVTGAAAAGKVYDGTTAAVVNGATLAGVLGSDAVVLGNDTTGSFATKNAGNGIAVGTAMTISGTDAGNYLIVQPSGLAANITPLGITVTAAGHDKAYDGTTTAGVTLASTGVIQGDSIGFTDTSANFNTPNVGTAIPIAVLGIGSTGADAGNYTLLNNTANTQANITPAILNLTGTRVYDATTGAAATLFGSSGVLTGVDGQTLTLTGTGTLSTKNVGNQVAFAGNGLAGFTLTGNGTALASNYTFAGGTDWVTITPATLTVSGTSAASKIYDGTTAASLSGATLQGVLLADSVALGNDTTGTFATKNVGTAIPVGTAMTISGTDAGNYRLVQPTGLAANISPLGITATAAGVNKVYDATTTATVVLSSAGVVPGDNVRFTDTSANFTTPNVGNAIPIAVLGITSSGTDAGNYTLLNSTANTSADITPVVLNLTGSRVYDATTGAAASLFGTGDVLTGVAGQTLTLGGAGTLASKNVGVQAPFATGGLGGFTLTGNGTALASNYTLAGGTDWVTVTPATLTVSGTVAANKVYDTTTTATLSGATLQGVLLADNVALGNDTSGTFASKNVGNNIAVGTAMTIGGTDAGNYLIVQPTGLAANITPASVTVSATGQNKVYDSTTVATVGLTASGVLPGDSLSFTDAAANFATANAGNAIPISVTGIAGSGAALGNYSFNTTATTSADITPVVLNLTGSRTYDGSAGAAAGLFGSGGVLTGVAGQTLTLGGTGTLSTKNVGSQQPFAANGLTGFTLTGNGTALASNYTLAGGTDWVTITPLAITVNATGQNKVYDSTTVAGVTLGSGGVIAGDVVNFADTAANFATANAGNAIPISVTGISASGADAGNYSFVTTAATSANIAPAVLNLTGSRTYDGSTGAAAGLFGSGGVLTGVAGQTLTLGGTGTLSTKNVGSQQPFAANGLAGFTLSGNGTALASNYTLAGGTDWVTITPLTITVNATGQNKVYDGSTVAGVTLASSGVLAGDTVSFTDSAANFATPNAGNAIPISVTGIGAAGADAGNYNFGTTAVTSANIAPAVLNLTGSRTYDGSTGAAAGLFGSGGVLTGVAGQTLTLGGTGTLSTKNVGSQQPFAANGLAGFTLTGNGTALAGNYTFAGGADWVTITPATLTVSGTVAANKVYDATSAATLSGATLQGVLAADNVVLGNDTNGTFAAKNVGTGITVGTAMTIGGADSGNYLIVQPAGLAANITPATVTVSATGQNKVYDSTTAAVASLSSNGVFAGDTLTFTSAAANFATPNAGNAIPIAVTGIAGSGADLGNYIFNSTAAASANITPAILSLTATRVYDATPGAAATLFGSNGVLSGVNGQTLTLGGAGTLATKNVGSERPFAADGLSGFTLTGNGMALASNYIFAGGTDWVTVTPATLSVSGTKAANKPYDGTTAATLRGATLQGVLLTDNVALGNDNIGAFATRNVGNNIAVSTFMTISGADAGNYLIVQPAGLAANITPITPPVFLRSAADSYNSMLAQLQGMLGPQPIPTPYGTANQTETGIFFGNPQPENKSMQRNRMPADFRPGLGLSVIDGGVKLPMEAGL